jgi:DNA-binding MarR family transcriptional regulator
MTRWLCDDEQRAWRAYRRMVLLVDARIARELAHDSGLSIPDYQVLSALSEAPERRRRLSEIAATMQWSPSRLSHHVSRMEQRGLVARCGCAADGRGAFVVLADAGWEAIRAAAPEHVASVRRHLIDLLSPGQLAALTEIGETVIAHFDADATQGSPAPDPASHDADSLPSQSSKDSPDSRSYAST